MRLWTDDEHHTPLPLLERWQRYDGPVGRPLSRADSFFAERGPLLGRLSVLVIVAAIAYAIGRWGW